MNQPPLAEPHQVRIIPLMDLNHSFLHENRQFGGNDLYVDLIPRSCWFSNARAVLTNAAWEKVKKIVVERADGVCEVCERKPYPKAKIFIEVHERWGFDQTTHTQILTRLIALCSTCHRTTHFGLALHQGREKQAFAHLKKVNKWSDEQANKHILHAFDVWAQRNKANWALDLTLLLEEGFDVKKEFREHMKGEQ